MPKSSYRNELPMIVCPACGETFQEDDYYDLSEGSEIVCGKCEKPLTVTGVETIHFVSVAVVEPPICPVCTAELPEGAQVYTCGGCKIDCCTSCSVNAPLPDDPSRVLCHSCDEGSEE